MTGSERLVGEAFRTLIPLRKGRILVVSFASNVHRMQQAIDVAVQVGRKVAIVGRSMRKNLNIARGLGYLDVPEHMLVKPQEAMELPPGQVMILCTGSQGEPMSALTRIAYNDHPSISIERGDTVILSAKPVPGNELRVHDSINRLAQMGAEVLHQEIAPVHVSGHACSEEMRTLLSLVRPRAVMPVHGEYRMLAAHGQLGARGRRARGRDPDRRERLRRRARAAGERRGSSTGSRRASRSSTASGSATCRTSRSATAAASPRTAS